jgi:2-keto-4-pentenoate hydratase/2-oxohepta-3-ene-1,7-dioic acid hydratase in catechol pathway
MKLVTFDAGGESRVGALVDRRILDLSDLAPSMVDFLAGGEELLEQARTRVRALEKVGMGGPTLRMWRGEESRLRAPLLRPGKILCVGLNYTDHIAEQGVQPPASPVFFAKYANTLIGPDEPIVLPRSSAQVDYEAELAFVIGRRAKHVPEAEAMRYVAGYTVCHDVSARDFQFGDGQWTRGKSCDTFCPIGPALVTTDEVPDPHALDIALRLNGQVMQSSNTRNLLFKIPFLVHFITRAMTLEPGDIISTGTPPGVGCFRKPPVFLAAGDVVEITIAGVGTLRNPVAAE